MEKMIRPLVKFYDILHSKWESKSIHQFFASVLVFTFIISLSLALINSLDCVPVSIKPFLPSSIFHAIQISFSIVLLIEVIGLVFSISYSITSSLVKQLEILSLILLRSAFKLFGEFSENENWDDWDPIISMLSDAFGAVIIFIIILLINKTLKHTPITDDPSSQTSFIMFKKLTGLFLFSIFLISGLIDSALYLKGGHIFDFFKTFYTILIFTDIFLVLLSMRYNYSFIVVFRNSAYAVATIIIRMALSAPTYYNIVLGILASLFVLLVSFFYTKYRHCNSDLH